VFQHKKTNLEEFKMGKPKKNDIHVYTEKEITERRQELLDQITKSNTYLPDSILHDDLDMGMLEFVKLNLRVISDGEQIPIIPKILTVQRWGEISSNWTFSDEDGNMKVPFIGVVRRPDVQPGTNPVIQRTIPDRRTFHYATVPTWNGSQMGADIYKMPQPVAIDIGFEVTIVCHKFRDLNRFNKIVLQKFSSRQAYTMVKGHYIPIVLDKISDNSPIDALDSRRYYLQKYEFTMLGFLIDSEEFEVKPAVNRLFLLTEFIQTKNYEKKFLNKSIETKNVTFVADGSQTVFSVGETIGFLFFVSVNGIIQERDTHYYWIGQTSKIVFQTPPLNGSVIMVSYYAGRSNVFMDAYGTLLFLETENFVYEGPTIYSGSTATFTVLNNIDSVIYVDINGLVDEEGHGFAVTDTNQVTLYPTDITPLVSGSRIGICYLR
jgi:hypothetical protein